MIDSDAKKLEEIEKDLKMGDDHIVIDFDLKNEDCKSREGMHLYYIYSGVEALEKIAAANDKMVKKFDDLNDKINKLTLAIGKLKEAVSKSAGRR